MKVTKFQAKNVRGFKDEINIEFGKFNVFIGENSSGKSNLINLIRTVLQTGNNTAINVPPFDGRFSEPSNFSCLMEFDRKDIEGIYSTEAFNQMLSEYRTSRIQGIDLFKNDLELFNKQQKLEFSSSWSREGNMIIRQSFPALRSLIVPDQTIPNYSVTANQINFVSRIYALAHQLLLRDSIFVSDTRDLSVQFPMATPNQITPIDPNSILTYVSRWMMNDRPTYDRFMELVKRLLPRLSDLQVEPSGGTTANLFIKENGLVHLFSGNDLSKGSREILVVLGALALAGESSTLFIEEPEIHLHPNAVKELKSIMLAAVKMKNVQIVISTHHPLFLQDLDPEADKSVKVFKFENVNQSGNRATEIMTDKEISELTDKLVLNAGH